MTATSTNDDRQVSRVRLAPRSAPTDQQQWESWAEKICAAFSRTVTSIIETGRLLNEAKENLGHGSFEAMVELRLPFKLRTAQMFMAIAKHPVLSEAKHVSLLPPSWGTLYQITRLPLRLVEECIEDGRINPKTERKDIAALAGKQTKKRVVAKKLTGTALKVARPQPASDEIAPDEELALLREFAHFVVERANSVSVSPADHAEWKVLRDRVKAVLR